MGFGCPICSEKLDKLPAEAQNRAGGGSVGELNISATPCGHIFHSYCIQKWLSGNLASSKQCPCCRKSVPALRCLALFPTTYDESILDDSLSQAPDAFSRAPCDHLEQMSVLKNKINRLESEAKDRDQMYNLLTDDHDTLLNRFQTEKMTSDTWMMKAKQFESYRDLANEMETRAVKAEAQLRTFSQIESLINGVERSVNEELSQYPPTLETVRSLLEMKNVLSTELKHANSKYNDLKISLETCRKEKMKEKLQHDKKARELKELQHVYEISRVNGKIRSASPPAVADLGSTPKQFRTKRRFQEPSATVTSSTKSPAGAGVDSDVDVFPVSFKPKKAKPTVSTAAAGSFASSALTKSKSLVTLPTEKKEEDTSSGKVTKPQKKLLKQTTQKFPCGLSPIVPPSAVIGASTTDKKKNSPDSTIDLCSDSDGVDGDSEELRIRGNVPGAPLPMSVNRFRALHQKSSRPVLGTSCASGSTPKPKKFNFKKGPSQ